LCPINKQRRINNAFIYIDIAKYYADFYLYTILTFDVSLISSVLKLRGSSIGIVGTRG